MIIQFIYGVIAALIMSFVAVGAFWFMLRQMDKWLEADFKNAIYPKLATDPKALSLYLAARLIAVAIIVAAIAGRFI